MHLNCLAQVSIAHNIYHISTIHSHVLHLSMMHKLSKYRIHRYVFVITSLPPSNITTQFTLISHIWLELLNTETSLVSSKWFLLSWSMQSHPAEERVRDIAINFKTTFCLAKDITFQRNHWRIRWQGTEKADTSQLLLRHSVIPLTSKLLWGAGSVEIKSLGKSISSI